MPIYLLFVSSCICAPENFRRLSPSYMYVCVHTRSRSSVLASSSAPLLSPESLTLLEVDRLVVRVHAGLLEGLAERGVRVARPGDVLRARPVLDP